MQKLDVGNVEVRNWKDRSQKLEKVEVGNLKLEKWSCNVKVRHQKVERGGCNLKVRNWKGRSQKQNQKLNAANQKLDIGWRR